MGGLFQHSAGLGKRMEHWLDKDMIDEQLAELAPWSEKLQSIKNRMWIIVNYSNSQRAGVILYLTALIFGAYLEFAKCFYDCFFYPNLIKTFPAFFSKISLLLYS